MAYSFDESQLGERLLALLRRESGDSSLAYRSPPARMQGGMETLIYALELESPPDALSGPLVLRSVPENYDPQRVLWEAAVQEAAAEQGYAAPRPRLAWADPEDVGRAFVIMDRVPGEPLGFSGDAGPFVSSSRVSRAWYLLRTLLRATSMIDEMTEIMTDQLASLHQLDAEPARRKAKERNIPPAIYEVNCFIDGIAQRVDELQLDGFRPAVEWLREHEPQATGDVICHGDFFNVNILVDGRTVTGVIDWSFARIGDPAFDVGSTRAIMSMLAGVLPGPLRPLGDRLLVRAERRFRERYEQTIPLSEDGVGYWAAARSLFQLLRLATQRARGPAETGEFLGGGEALESPGLIERDTDFVRSVTGETVTLPSAKNGEAAIRT